MKYRNVVMLVIIAVVAFSGFSEQQQRKVKLKPSSKIKTVSYKKDIVPVMKKYCLPCHSEEQMNPSELYLTSFEETMKGGKHGMPVVPGKADSSIMIKKCTPAPPFGERMPYRSKTPLPQDTLDIVRAWITQGAKNN